MKKLPANLKQIIRLLNMGHFYTGTALGEKLKITRSAVWKYIKQLQTYGVEIITDKALGYSMPQPLILLDANTIKKNLEQNDLAVNIEIFNEIPSTSDYLKTKKITPNNNKKLYLCLAEQQTNGRGRLGRTWHSPFGSNIYFSCLWHFHKDISDLAGLSLVIGLALIRTLVELGISEGIKIKWPNDILWHQQKLAGVLIEINAETHGHSQVIIGVGLNVNMISADEINQPWTSLQQITGHYQDRNQIVALLIKHLADCLDQFMDLGFKSFLHEWPEHDALLHKTIHLEHGRNTVTGIACGVNERGNLIVRHDNDHVITYSSGDTVIKK